MSSNPTTNTHYAVVVSHQGAPGMTLIATGPEDFCRDSLDRWTAAHPLLVWEHGEVLARTTAPEPRLPLLRRVLARLGVVIR